ncbi:GAF domain-containing protein [Pseudoflavonifractor sp. MSJ-30]|uniref:GAF domain-containing protein n=1 Tax=Pseudoflavonifractor sp. MSJ-30 TaxID=2841525 RepID=UPI001C121174|nr:GAF domain-containing protein [Pseudoflavonifractor sp. MSJ-30]MBU5452630.1 GAF domain-containing protein [Pseudoflavonifractor sp. MSJ-30]
MKFETDYASLCRDLASLTENVPYLIANLANTSALIWERMEGLNWAGFYILTDGALVLGPFQGKTACIRIPLGRGVCGTAAEQGRTQLVENVHNFPGHIACDCASNSEVVVPLYKNGNLWGVLDLDSPYVGRFTENDRQELENLTKIIEAFL